MSKKPSLIAYTVKERGKGQSSIWTKIGAAWKHSDEFGYSVVLDAFPVDGRIVLIEPKADSASDTLSSDTFESEAGDA